MTFNQAFFAHRAPRALALLRFVTAFLFLQHGTATLFHFPQVVMFDTLPRLSLIGFAGLLEVVGGILLLLGLFTRPTAFLRSGEMAVVYFMAHASQGYLLSLLLNHGESVVLFCFIFLFLSVAGAGDWSLDAKRHRSAPA